jgi:hypothetical protein
VIEKPGRIRVIDRGALVPDAALDVSASVATGGEQGLLGMAVDPATRLDLWRRNDVHRTAQDPPQRLGKILRLDFHVSDVASAIAEERAVAERG